MQIRHATENDLSDLLELIRKGLGDEDAQEDFVRANLSKLPSELVTVLINFTVRKVTTTKKLKSDF